MNSLQVSTYLSGYKPIPNSLPDWEPGRQATWPATTATLISVDGQAVLIDSLMTITEGAEHGRWIARSDVGELTNIYVTHGHADHFFGATTVLEQFPDARLVARPEVADAAREQTSAGYLQVWTSFFPGQLTIHPAAPNPLKTPPEDCTNRKCSSLGNDSLPWNIRCSNRWANPVRPCGSDRKPTS